MRKIKFVSMKIEDRMVYDHDEILEVVGCMSVQDEAGGFVRAEDTVEIKRVVVPINTIKHINRPDLYIAYSPEVEDILNIPIAAIVRRANTNDMVMVEREREISRLKKDIKKINNAGFIDRLKYLFRKKF